MQNNIKYQDLINEISKYMNSNHLSIIDKYYSCALSMQERLNEVVDKDFLIHPLNVAYSLALIKMDATTIGCALIHEAVSLELLSIDDIKNLFGEESAIIINCLTKISSIKKTFTNEKHEERYRKIVVGLAENPKALFIKFADRIDNLKTIKDKPKKLQKEMVEDTQNILIPIAHRLGVKTMKSELEDLCLKYTDPKGYERVLQTINASRDELEMTLEEIASDIKKLLEDENINFSIVYRVKSVRGIYNKLKSGRSWNNIYDLLGVRVLVKKIEECYLVVGIIHSKYTSIPKRFKDFIANPKSNMYQSIHTTIFTGKENNQVCEVQVRTYEMDEIAEKGVASHWSYKENVDGRSKSIMEQKLEAFRTLIELNDLDKNSKFFTGLNKEFNNQEIYVFTPRGDIIDLPVGSTPVDFAYKIHSEIGNTLVSALVNGKMVKLNYKLQNDDIVVLNTQKGKSPSRDWLKFVKTSSAKNRIKSYFYKNKKDKYIALGREMLLSEANKLKLEFDNELIRKILISLNNITEEELYFSISILKFLPSNILKKVTTPKPKKKIRIDKNKNVNHNIMVEGYSDIKTIIAPCCKPVMGEEIIGFITNGNGIKIHSINCKNVDLNSQKIIECHWNENVSGKSETFLKVYIDETKDNLIDIISLSSKYDINMERINIRNSGTFDAHYDIEIRVNNIKTLNLYIEELLKIDFVLRVERLQV